ncbi:MAG: tRNA-dihydrouridine synthase [Candidatus Moraniibacteriota bacterium]|nr:MAG: tRNA-dihydrouridine synthase [Candidatus Moranbacteria bacterium]
MSKGFWEKLETPFFALAPMYDVTDAAFRRMIAKYSAPDVIFTEFVSVDGLSHPKGREKLMHHLWFDESERFVVAQVFGVYPKNFEKVAQLCKERGFDGIDINMGCPEKNIVKQGTGSALINDPELAKDIISATISGAGDMPVSVKTRIGFNKEEIDQWLPHILEKDVAALTVHLRTRKEMSKVPAHWNLMSRIVDIKNDLRPEVKLLGNGDVTSVVQGKELIKRYGCDGVMIGRGVFGNPWIFSGNAMSVSMEEKLRVMVEHTKLFAELFTGIKNFAIMKKHYKAYISGFPQASNLRAQLMNARDATHVEDIVDNFLSKK